MEQRYGVTKSQRSVGTDAWIITNVKKESSKIKHTPTLKIGVCFIYGKNIIKKLQILQFI